jgi:hypothetical protein
MTFLKILERAWLAAVVAAIILGTYNLIMLRTIGYQVYFPYICAVFCFLIYRNIKSQRTFKENMDKK